MQPSGNYEQFNVRDVANSIICSETAWDEPQTIALVLIRASCLREALSIRCVGERQCQGVPSARECQFFPVKKRLAHARLTDELNYVLSMALDNAIPYCFTASKSQTVGSGRGDVA